MNKTLKLSALFAAITLSSAAFAHISDQHAGYVSDQSTNDVTVNSYGECWQTEWADAHITENLRGNCAAKAPETVTERVTQKISLSADVLFDFDKSVIRNKDAVELVQLVDALNQAQSNGNTLESIRVVGHTDYVGTDSYNLKLSQKRADAVAAYLVSKGINTTLISTLGAGETQTSMTEQCKNIKKRADRNACLQPDRRVEILLDGTQVKTITKTVN